MPEYQLFDQLWKIFQAGGNAALIAFAFLVWKIERRLFQVEVALKFLTGARESAE